MSCFDDLSCSSWILWQWNLFKSNLKYYLACSSLSVLTLVFVVYTIKWILHHLKLLFNRAGFRSSSNIAMQSFLLGMFFEHMPWQTGVSYQPVFQEFLKTCRFTQKCNWRFPSLVKSHFSALLSVSHVQPEVAWILYSSNIFTHCC
jgi:hypothetical protein